MTTTQIVLLIIGIIIVILSFFVVDREEPKKTKSNNSVPFNKELWADDILQIRAQVKQFLQDDMNHCINETEDSLSRISNEKIMAVQEYCEQLLLKIEHNNEEVVFLYNMLKNKEEEFKTVCNKLESAKRENKELLEKLDEFHISNPSAFGGNGKESLKKYIDKSTIINNKYPKKGLEEVDQNSNNILMSIDSTFMDTNHKSSNSKKDVKTKNKKELSIEEEILSKKNDEILKLYRQNKSITEISKILGLGQGEVRLIIELYGHK